MQSGVATQRIVKVRRDYNKLVANETMEDFALRFTPRAFRKWSPFRVANTAIGGVSFLALEAIGGSITLNYGYTNAVWAIAVVSVIVFVTALPISYRAARSGIDMDLLTRGAGFGYIGSTFTSLIYATFTFIFFAIEAAIMALALELYFGLSLPVGYLVSSLVVIPLVMYGITFISRLQLWTQPLWLVLLALPYVCILVKSPESFAQFATFNGRAGDSPDFDWLLFGAASTVAFSLIAQIGEQVDFLRFLPEKTARNRVRWWSALLLAGPGWIVPGAAKMLGGAFLAFLALQHEIDIGRAVEPTQMYLVGFGYVFSNPQAVLAATALFVVVSQIKINVTNAYAGSLAWSNFFARVTKSHPGRVVWLVLNVLIAMMLMVLGVFQALEHVLGIYSNVAIAWVGALVADLVINKPLGLSPAHIEFKRAHLYDVNPVGVGALLVASTSGMAAYAGAFGEVAHAFSAFIALAVALLTAPLIALLTRGRYYIARESAPAMPGSSVCSVCDSEFESEDMAHCPAYGGPICSLCCTLDARCLDRCKSAATISEQVVAMLGAVLPYGLRRHAASRVARYVLLLAAICIVVGGALLAIYHQGTANLPATVDSAQAFLEGTLVRIFAVLMIVAAVIAWWLILAKESRKVAEEESTRQTQLLMREIDAHRRTDAELQRAKEEAEAANEAKSRYVTGVGHELRTPLNSILGYAQILGRDPAIPPRRREAVAVIRRSGEHLLSLIDGMLDIARIEAGRLRLDTSELRLADLLDEIVKMFRPQAAERRLAFSFVVSTRLPEVVHGDVKRLRQILINLLANAIKFTERGSVTLRVSYLREMATFEIADTGIGIAEDDLTHIFMPFERGTTAAGQGEPGTGLGLTIAKLLTELMGGQISVISTPGQGSTFAARVYLPAVSTATTAPLSEPGVGGYAGAVKTILVVDDQAPQRNVLCSLLSALGFATLEADSGEACLRVVSERSVDAILLDLAMPDISGWDTIQRLRAAGVTEVPIIIVSANALENTRERHALSACDDFIVKPVLEAELLSKLKLHLRLQYQYPSDSIEGDATTTAALTRPSQAHVAELKRLGSMGYVKGIRSRLDEIEREEPQCGAFVLKARELVCAFRLNDYMRLINKDPS
ncbi:MAG: hybrid sensor histidine kinase/response regulator [Betaproteobacteria bacterium]|nr:hybrid sensor histidine kinase/response regulator [Betaproteobacteria bacterium]